jgi:hypothetical protein
MMSLSQENPSKPGNIYAQPTHLTYNPQTFQYTLPASASAWHHIEQFIHYTQLLLGVMSS